MVITLACGGGAILHKGYDSILVANEILIINPGTREIVEIFQI